MPGCGCEGECGCQSLVLPAIQGENGLSAYELAVNDGFVGTISAWLLSLHGQDGTDGTSAYQLALDNGFVGTEAQWLASLVGDSAYEVAVANGFVGTEALWLLSLVGAAGTNGDNAWCVAADGGGGTAFSMPTLNGFVTVTCTTGTTFRWCMLQQWVFVENAGYMVCIGTPTDSTRLLANPGGLFGFPSGLTANVAPGTPVAIGSKISPGGRPGVQGIQGVQGESAYEVAVGDGFVGTVTEWLASLVGPPGSGGTTTIFVSFDPNTQVSTFGAPDGTIAIRTDVVGQITYWQRASPGVWTLMGTLSAGTTPTAHLFMANKTIDQFFPIGSTTALTINIDATSPAPYFNSGAWTLFQYKHAAGWPTPQQFTAQQIVIEKVSGAAESKTFTVAWFKNGVSFSSSSVVVTTPATSATLAVLVGSTSLATDDIVQLRITPTTAPGSQWKVDKGIIAFNQD